MTGVTGVSRKLLSFGAAMCFGVLTLALVVGCGGGGGGGDGGGDGGVPPPGTATVRGQVTDTQGQPIRGATVTITTLSPVRVATTDFRGGFVFEGVPVGVHTFEVRALNFMQARIPQAITAPETTINVSLPREQGGGFDQPPPPPKFD